MSAGDSLNSEQFGYRGGHQPMADGPPLHDLTAAHFPSNVYSELHHYTHMSGRLPYDKESISAVQSARGKPNAQVTVYRAAPAGVTHINPGDWVSVSPSYAQQHARQGESPAEDWPVHSARVPAHTVRNGGNDIVEWGYHGDQPVPVRTQRPPKRGWPDNFE